MTYDKALGILPDFETNLIPKLQKHLPELIQTRVNLCNNLALAFNNSGDYDSAIEVGKLSICTDSNNAKSFFRLG